MRKLLVLSTVVLAVGSGVATNTAQAKSASAQENSRIDNYISAVWHHQRVMGERLTPTNYSYKRTHSDKYRHWVLKYWKGVNNSVSFQFQNPPHEASWYCIHRYEGSWTDHGAPYYGGLQMDIGFQGAYGSYLLVTKGTADNWTPLEQMWVAEIAFRSGRGFYPWPQTARMCGLL